MYVVFALLSEGSGILDPRCGHVKRPPMSLGQGAAGSAWRRRGAACTIIVMRVALGADENLPLVADVVRYLEERGHQVDRFGAPSTGKQEAWARVAAEVAEAVARADYDFGVVCCWTGTGVTIAANKVPRIRAALCGDAQTARGARKWNDANVLTMSLRATAPAVAREILDAWLDEDYDGTEDESLAAIRALEEPEPHSSGGPSRSSAR